MALLQIELDDALKDNAQAVLNNVGMDISIAVRVFLHQCVRENGLPFIPKADPFYAPSNVRHLKGVMDDIRNNKNIESHPLTTAVDK